MWTSRIVRCSAAKRQRHNSYYRTLFNLISLRIDSLFQSQRHVNVHTANVSACIRYAEFNIYFVAGRSVFYVRSIDTI